jgi:hypothetical protein
MKLVNNARAAWRWYSMQAMAVAGALQGAWLALGDMQSRVPAEAVDALTIAILASGIVGRLVKQTPDE